MGEAKNFLLGIPTQNNRNVIDKGQGFSILTQKGSTMPKPKIAVIGQGDAEADAAMRNALSNQEVEVVHINDDIPIEEQETLLSRAANLIAPVLPNGSQQPRNRAERRKARRKKK